MKKSLRLKPFVVPTIYVIALFTLVVSVFYTAGSLREEDIKEEELVYVSSSIFESDIPVINTDIKIIRPYSDTSITIGKYFYDIKDDNTRQENSIVLHENTYMQNSGVDYVLDNTFDVISILDGTVINVKDDELLGKIVEIRHENDLISIYQSLSEVSVKKDDVIKQGAIIGKSGTNKLDEAIKNHLHFELSHNGQIVNPENYYDKSLSDL